MRIRHPRVLDATAIAALFDGHPRLLAMMGEAEAGWWNLILPAACIADAEQAVRAGHAGWEAILLTPGVITLPLEAHSAIEVGAWPGPLWACHAAHEAAALRAVVVTCDPGSYDGLLVALLKV